MAEVSKNILTSEQIENIVTFAQKIRRKMGNADYNGKKELIGLLNVRVDLVCEEESYRLAMSCDLPGSDYAKVNRLRESYSLKEKVDSA